MDCLNNAFVIQLISDYKLLFKHCTVELDGVDMFKYVRQNGVSVDNDFGGGRKLFDMLNRKQLFPEL